MRFPHAIHRRIHQRAGLDIPVGLLHQGDLAGERDHIPVPRPLHRRPPDRLREHVVAERPEVSSGKRLEKNNRRVGLPIALRPNPEIREPLGADLLRALCQLLAGHELREAEALDPGQLLAEFLALRKFAPLLAGDPVCVRKKTRRAAKDLLVLAEPPLDLQLQLAAHKIERLPGIFLRIELLMAGHEGGDDQPRQQDRQRPPACVPRLVESPDALVNKTRAILLIHLKQTCRPAHRASIL